MYSNINLRRLETILLNAPQVFVNRLAWVSDLLGERWNRFHPMTQEDIDIMGRGWLAASERGWDLMWRFCHQQATAEELDELRHICKIERTRRFHLRESMTSHCDGLIDRFVKEMPPHRVAALAPDIDAATLYSQKAAKLRSRYGGVYECHHCGEVVIFSVTRGRPDFGSGKELWELYLLSGGESSMLLLMNQTFHWDHMDTEGRIDVDCQQDSRLLKVVVSADRMRDMLNTTELNIFIERNHES